MLLISASLCLRSFERLTHEVPLGLQPERLLTFMLTASPHNIETPADAAPAFARILERVANTPGVEFGRRRQRARAGVVAARHRLRRR